MKRSIVIDLEGALLRSSSIFPYFMLVAIEAGSPVRALMLLLSVPLAWIFSILLCSELLELHVFAFIATCGLRSSTVESVSRAVLSKHYLDDLNPDAYPLFRASSQRLIVTRLPYLMVHPFARHYLDASVVGSELLLSRHGYCTGFVRSLNRERLVREALGDSVPSIGVFNRDVEPSLTRLCERSYIVQSETTESVPKKEYIKPLIFHDGRLVNTPTPFRCLIIVLWLPIGLPLALVRLAFGLLLPKSLGLLVDAFLGVSVRVQGNPPLTNVVNGQDRVNGVLFVCTHRSLLDPIFISYARMRSVTTVTYSVSPLSEVLSPIRTARLTRSREHDARTMSSLLSTGDLAVCPEGTTCREPYLLRFSALFAELTDRIVPVAVTPRLGMFHATTARGWKALDPLFFFMNPLPGYEVRFLEQLPAEETCVTGGKPSHEVANNVQRKLADALGYECTNLTRKDKYRMLVENDGIVTGTKKSFSRSRSLVRKITMCVVKGLKC